MASLSRDSTPPELRDAPTCCQQLPSCTHPGPRTTNTTFPPTLLRFMPNEVGRPTAAAASNHCGVKPHAQNKPVVCLRAALAPQPTRGLLGRARARSAGTEIPVCSSCLQQALNKREDECTALFWGKPRPSLLTRRSAPCPACRWRRRPAAAPAAPHRHPSSGAARATCSSPARATARSRAAPRC